eukprot:Phypoly_transcript_01722.p1 GENE.Phypoly_transcript_01722~~Phypoly_transcript_01722.p1  ORF type:complete len:895 (+),score=269.30 Phypoly_transcript_01722:367-3051(+)
MSHNSTRPKNTKKTKAKDYENYGQQGTKPNGTYKPYSDPSSSPHPRSSHKPPPHPNGSSFSSSSSPSPHLHSSSHPNKRPTHPHDPHYPSSSPSPSYAHRPPNANGHPTSSPHPSPSSSHPHPSPHSSHAPNAPNGFTRRGSRHERTHSHPPPDSRVHDQPSAPEDNKSTPPDTTDLSPAEMESHLHHLWNLAFDKSKNLTIPNHERPVVYRDASNAWGSESKNAFLSDFNFCAELKKSYIAKYGNPAQPGQSTQGDENGNAKNGAQSAKSDENGRAKNSVHSKEHGGSVNSSDNNGVNRETKTINNINNTNNINKTNAINNSNNTTNVNNINKNKIDTNNQPNANNSTKTTPTNNNDTTTDTNTKSKNKKNKANEKITNKQEQKEPTTDKTKQGQKDTKQKEKQETKQTETKQKELKQEEVITETKQEEIKLKEEKEQTEDKEAKEEEGEKAEEEEIEGKEIEDSYTYDFTNDEYEEIADPVDTQKGNPGDVIIDIPDMPDMEDYTPQPTKPAQNGKAAGKPGKNKKAKKGKSKPAPKHQSEPEKEKAETSKNSLISNANNNNYANSIINLTSNGNNEAWNDILGNLLPRPKAEITKVSGTNNLQIDKIGSYTLEHDNAQAKAALLNGIPREVARVFGNRFGKQNTTGNLALPVKWSSGEGLMTAGRKFPMEVPFLSLKDMFGAAKPTSKLSCANLKCSNTTSEDKPFKTCAKCNMTAYCSRECQVEDWAKRHKQTCKPNAAEEQRKTYATQKFWATASIRHMIFLHWYARYGKGVIVIMCKDFLAFSEDDPSGRDLYVFYVPMADLASDDCPIPALKKCQAEFTKSFVNHDADSHSIASAAVDSTGFITSQIDEVKVLQLKLHKRSCKEHDLQKVDAIAVDSHNQATLYTFH